MADPKQLASLLSEEEELRRFNAAQGDQPWYSKALPMEGRATFLPFRDTMEGSVFNKRELALPGILAGAVNAFTSPARALTGSDPTFKPGEEAANMALNTFGGGVALGRVAPAESGALGMNIGPKAANWDAAAYERALKLKDMGLSQNEVKVLTGNEQMPVSGTWSQMISDKNSLAYPHKLPSTEIQSTNLFDQMNNIRPITEVFNHPEFFNAYPEAKNIRIGRESGSGATFQPGSLYQAPTIYIGDNVKTPEALRTVLLHELQHYVQTKENWPRGGNIDEMMIELKKNPGLAQTLRNNPLTQGVMSVFDKVVTQPKAERKYMNLEGEAQARATESGKNLSAAEQRRQPTQERYDTALGNLDARYDFSRNPMSRKQLLQQEFDKINK